MATENQAPASQPTQTLTVSNVSLQLGSEGGEVVTTRWSFDLLSNGETVALTIGSGGSPSAPTAGQIWPLGLV